MYISRSDQPGTRGSMSLEQARKELGHWQQDAPKDATLRILRDYDLSTYLEYRYTEGDDGYWAWHIQGEQATYPPDLPEGF